MDGGANAHERTSKFTYSDDEEEEGGSTPTRKTKRKAQVSRRNGRGGERARDNSRRKKKANEGKRSHRTSSGRRLRDEGDYDDEEGRSLSEGYDGDEMDVDAASGSEYGDNRRRKRSGSRANVKNSKKKRKVYEDDEEIDDEDLSQEDEEHDEDEDDMSDADVKSGPPVITPKKRYRSNSISNGPTKRSRKHSPYSEDDEYPHENGDHVDDGEEESGEDYMSEEPSPGYDADDGTYRGRGGPSSNKKRGHALRRSARSAKPQHSDANGDVGPGGSSSRKKKAISLVEQLKYEGENITHS
ncbi:hypothetical protein HK102_011947, partial [Quaeritorhiza haematococci]